MPEQARERTAIRSQNRRAVSSAARPQKREQQSYVKHSVIRTTGVSYVFSDLDEDEQEFSTTPTSSAALLDSDLLTTIYGLPVPKWSRFHVHPSEANRYVGHIGQVGQVALTGRGTLVGHVGHINYYPHPDLDGQILSATGSIFYTDPQSFQTTTNVSWNRALAGELIDLDRLMSTSSVAVSDGTAVSLRGPQALREAAVAVLVQATLVSLTFPEKEQLAERLSELNGDAGEEQDPDHPGIAISSLKTFLGFIQAHQDLKCPVIALTPECEIYATWKDGPTRVFSIHFLHDDNVRFVIFHPNSTHPGKTIRMSGTATADVVVEIATSHGVRNWAAR